MSIWKKNVDLEQIRRWNAGTLVSILGIQLTGFTENSLTATMPVTSAHLQPLGYLHGGASVVLTESVGSLAAHLAADEGRTALGMEINASHLKAVRSGILTAVASPIRLGFNTHVWNIEVRDEALDRVCDSRLTTFIKAIRG